MSALAALRLEPLTGAQRARFAAVHALLGACLGEAPALHARATERLDEPGVLALAGYEGAPSDEALVGFLLAGPVRRARLAADGAFGAALAAALDEVGDVAGERATMLFALAVAPRARRRGVGRALGAEALARLAARGVRRALGVCWDHGGPDTSRALFERGGFVERARSTEFFALRAARGEHACPVCAGPCGCTARLYLRDL